MQLNESEKVRSMEVCCVLNNGNAMGKKANIGS